MAGLVGPNDDGWRQDRQQWVGGLLLRGESSTDPTGCGGGITRADVSVGRGQISDTGRLALGEAVRRTACQQHHVPCAEGVLEISVDVHAKARGFCDVQHALVRR